MINAETTYRWTDEFGYNRDASEEMDSWFDQQYSNITSKNFPGFWYIENHFYDLQLGLFEGTKESLGKLIIYSMSFVLLDWDILNPQLCSQRRTSYLLLLSHSISHRGIKYDMFSPGIGQEGFSLVEIEEISTSTIRY